MNICVLGTGVVTPEGVKDARLFSRYRNSEAMPPARVQRLDGFDPISGRRLDRISKMALLAGRDAMADAAGIVQDPCRIGLVVGTVTGGIVSGSRFLSRALTAGGPPPSPLAFTNSVKNAVAGHLAIDIGVKGPCYTVCNDRITGVSAIIEACSMIEEGAADLVLTGRVEELPPWMETEEHWDMDIPASLPSREGAYMVTLTTLERAGPRPAAALIAGIGTVRRNQHPLKREVDGDACVQAVQECLERAGAEPEDVGLVLACIPEWDRENASAEQDALERVFDAGITEIVRPANASPSWLHDDAGRFVTSVAEVSYAPEKGLVLANNISLGGVYVSVLVGRTTLS